MRKHNRLKDIIINHIYDYCNVEVVQRLAGEGFTLTYSDPKHLQEPLTKKLMGKAIQNGSIKAGYTTRGDDYCEVIVEDETLHKTLIDKLLSLGFKKNNKLFGKVKKAHEELLATSYIARNSPVESEVRLTPKGLKHYTDGLSFERTHTANRNAVIAIIVSVISAGFTLATSLMQK